MPHWFQQESDNRLTDRHFRLSAFPNTQNTAYITCQNDKSENSIGHKIDFSRINNPGDNCEQVENYKSLYKKRQLPLVTINPKVDYVNFQMGYYYLPHKKKLMNYFQKMIKNTQIRLA